MVISPGPRFRSKSMLEAARQFFEYVWRVDSSHRPASASIAGAVARTRRPKARNTARIAPGSPSRSRAPRRASIACSIALTYGPRPQTASEGGTNLLPIVSANGAHPPTAEPRARSTRALSRSDNACSPASSSDTNEQEGSRRARGDRCMCPAERKPACRYDPPVSVTEVEQQRCPGAARCFHGPGPGAVRKRSRRPSRRSKAKRRH